MTIPMHVMIVGALTNLVLDPIFIFGFSAIPAMGIEGAAIATIIARTIATIWSISAVCKHSKHINIFKKSLGLKQLFIFETNLKQVSQNILSISLPLLASSLIAPIVLGAYYKILTPYGDSAKLLFTMFLTYSLMVMFPINGLAKSVNIMCSQNIGANNIGRSTKIFNTSILMSTLYLSCFSFCFYIFNDFFIDLFMEPESRTDSIKFAMLCFALSYPIMGVTQVTIAYIVSQNLGKHIFMIVAMSLIYSSLTYVYQLYYGESAVWLGILLGRISTIIHCALVIYFCIVKKRADTPITN